MRHSTATLAFLGSVLLSGFSVIDGANERLSVIEGGVKFKIDWYDDGRSKPYKAVFSDDGVRSIYKFNAEGRVMQIKVDSEKYKVLYKSNGDLRRVKLTSSRRRDLVEERGDQDAFDAGNEEASFVHRRLYACDDCEETWDVMCDEAVSTVCELEGYGSPLGQAASASIKTLCDTFGTDACSSYSGAEICQDQCDSSACDPNPCNEGTCSVDPGGGHICSCPSGSGGMSCQTDTSDLDEFYIKLRFIGTWTDEQKESLQDQADRWEEVITHVPCGGSNSDPAGRLLIKAKQDTIDGVGGTLGFAYSDYVWNDCPGITLSGVMKFDVDDLGELSTTELDLLYLHEMGHVIGIGTNWDSCSSCDSDRDDEWKCPAAAAVYNDLAGAPAGTPANIIELNGGSGTRCGHFDERLFDDELMTGYAAERGADEPLSKLSAAVLEDIEYIVDPSVMDAYTLPAQRDASDQSDNPAGDSTSRRRPDVAFNITRYLVGSDGSIVSEVPGIGMSF